MKKPLVTITNFGLNHVGYYDWLTLGFGMLAVEGKLGFRYRLPLAKSLMRHRYIRWGVKALAKDCANRINGINWCLEGTVDFGDRLIRFVVDVTDHGDEWDLAALERCDLYFKCQLPLSFPGPLAISSRISRSLPPEVLEQAAKIRSSALGRPLSRSLDFRKNLRLLRLWEAASRVPRSKRIFAYFGGDHDPEAGKYAGQPYQHPNEKRGRMVKFLRSLKDSRIDARLVTSQDPTLVGPELGLEAYRDSVATADFNINISGLSRSLPFRFIDSFLAGTTVPTDAVAIHWYQPFSEEEVIDLGPMGYELESDVDWDAIEKRLISLLDTPQADLDERRRFNIERYHQLWSPQALASYVLGEAQALA